MSNLPGFGSRHSFVTTADNASIAAGNGDYRVLATGNDTTITLGDGNQLVWVSGTGDSITIGNTSGGGGASLVDSSTGIAWISGGNGNITVLAAGNDNTVLLGDGHDTVFAAGQYNNIEVGTNAGTNDRNVVVTGGNSVVQMGAGANTVVAGGDYSTIATGDGVQDITALGSRNVVSIGNTPSPAVGDRDGWHGVALHDDHDASRSVIRGGDGLSVTGGNGNTTVVAHGGQDLVHLGNGDDSVFLLDGPNAGFSAVILGNGDNHVFLTGAFNTVIGGSGADTIHDGAGNDVFVLNGAGGNTTIDDFQASSHIVLSELLDGLNLDQTADGLAGNVTVTERADSHFGSGAVDTLITVTGSGGAVAHVTLANFDGGGLAAMLGNGELSA